MLHPQAEQLAATFKADFWAADHSIRWTAAEHESHIWLDERTVLAGTIDAQGVTEDGEPFFADWKTIGVYSAGKNNSKMAAVKAMWKFDPQALCYGLLLSHGESAPARFTVRWAVKSSPPTTDFEWYTYTQAECDWWKDEVLSIADQIRRNRFKSLERSSAIPRSMNNWPTNPTACTRYGWNLRCPLYDNGCTKLNFDFNPGLAPRDHHKELEDTLRAAHPQLGDGLVVLSSSSIELWLSCQEKFRRFYEGAGLTESSEALTIGTDFHTLIKDHIKSLIKD